LGFRGGEGRDSGSEFFKVGALAFEAGVGSFGE